MVFKKSKILIILTFTIIFLINVGLYFIPYFYYFSGMKVFVLVVAVISIAFCKDIFFNIYQFLFTVFYISPLVFLKNHDIENGLFFNQIVLSQSEVQAMTFYLLSTSIIFSFISFILRPRYIHINNKIGRPNILEWFFLVPIFLLISYINIIKGISVSELGYQNYIGGGLLPQKNIFILFLEIFFVSRILYFQRSYLAAILFIAYCLTGMLSGQRIPYAFMLLAYGVLFFGLDAKKSIYLICFSMVFSIAIPFLMWVQKFRNGLDLNLDIDFLIDSYSDFFHVVYFSLDTVKAVFMESLSSLDFNPFGKFYFYINLLFERVFGVNMKLDVNTFGGVFTKAIAPELYDFNITFASSAAAEFYYIFGFFGACLHVIYAFLICNLIWYVLDNLKTLSFFIVIFIARGFWGMVRNEPFGFPFDVGIWICLGVLMHSLVRVVVTRFCAAPKLAKI